MRWRDRSSLLLVAGLWVSLGVHAIVGMGFVRYSDSLSIVRVDHRPNPTNRIPPKPKPRPERPEEPPKVKLGIARSAANTITWLGYEEPTEHEAPRGKTEQSEMAIAPVGPPKPTTPGPEAAQAPQAPDLPSTQEVLKEQMRQSAKAVAGAIAAARQRMADIAEELARKQPPPGQTAAVPPVPEPPPTPAPKSTVSGAAGGGGGTPGEKSNKESMAVAIKDAPTVRPGRVVAAQGLEIRTVEPRWSTTTLMTRRPRNPTVLVTFWRDGKVRDVQWARDGDRVYDAGSAEVNQPLMTALYAWTASGKPLQDLDPKDPEASLTIMLTVILTG